MCSRTDGEEGRADSGCCRSAEAIRFPDSVEGIKTVSDCLFNWRCFCCAQGCIQYELRQGLDFPVATTVIGVCGIAPAPWHKPSSFFVLAGSAVPAFAT